MGKTSSFEVYKRAVTEFKDPTLKALLNNNPILFGQSMHNFLENAISLFVNPLEAAKRVSDTSEPIDYENNLIGDGVTTTFILEQYPESDLVDDCIFDYRINGEKVKATYDSEEHTVTFTDPIPMSSTANVNIYYPGGWNIELYDKEKYILSQFIVASWSEFINNDALDIIRLLGDTDFKLTSNATTTQAKTHWNVVNRETVCKRMNNYAWNCKYDRTY